MLVSNDENNTQATSDVMSSSRSLAGGGVTNNVAIASSAGLSSGSLAQGGTIVAPSTATIPNTTYVAISLSLFEIEQCKSKVLVILIVFVKDQVILYRLEVDDPKLCWTLFQQMYESFILGLCTLTTLPTFEQIVGKLLHEEE